ncbi:putative papain-like cysteine peptidase superfamily [Helianthus anomalus]
MSNRGRGRGKRGVASCSKKLREDELHVEFDDDMIAMDYLTILDDEPKEVFLKKKAKKNCTKWRSKLYRKYVMKNEEPFDDYKFLGRSKWPMFEKSAKARASARENKHFHRTGYRGLKDNFDDRWKQLSESNSSAKKLQHQRSQLWVAGQASQNKPTGLYEVNDIQAKVDALGLAESEMKADGTYYQGREDPLTRCFGPEREGQSRTVSYVIRNEDICKCDLLSVDDLLREITIAKGQAYPTRIRTLHTKHMKAGCAKVQVDTILPGYEDMDVPSETLLRMKLNTWMTHLLWAIPIVNQILRPQNEESNQEKQARKIKSALNVIKERPTWVQGIVIELEKHVGNCHLNHVPIEFSIPNGMYPYILKDFIETEALLQVFANGWVDITIIHWFAALFYTMSNDGERCNPCAFFGSNSINGEMCQRNPEEVKGHILGVYELHMDKQYFLAPYLANNHWSLFIISPTKKEVFILDSLKGNKDKNSYLLS